MTRIKMALGLGATTLALAAGGLLASRLDQEPQRSRGVELQEPASFDLAALPPPPPPSAPMLKLARMRPEADKPSEDAAEAAPKLIRTGEVSIEVADYGKAMKDLLGIVKGAGGYVASQSTGQGEHEKRKGRLQVRLPEAAFEGGYTSLKSLGKVRSESQNVRDVTKEYVDLQARLKVKQQTARRLEGLLATRTAKLADVLAAEKELARVTEEIESMEGERRYVDHEVAYCTLDIDLFEPQALVEPGAFNPLSRLLDHTLATLASSLAFLVASLAFLAPWAALGGLAWALVRRLRAPRPALKEEA